jgi:ABC-type Fe3+ transport system permease subunit
MPVSQTKQQTEIERKNQLNKGLDRAAIAVGIAMLVVFFLVSIPILMVILYHSMETPK